MDFKKIYKEKFADGLNNGFSTIDGYILPKRFEAMKNQVDDFVVREDDIWVCSFPKSGTTWLQETVWMIVNNLDYEGAKKNLDERSPYFEMSTVIDFQNMIKHKPGLKIPAFRQDPMGFIQSQKTPVIIKTHLPWDLMPKLIRKRDKQPKVIYIARDPRDVCVSYYHHSKLLNGYKGDFEEFCELFLADKVIYGPYWKHILSYWELKNNKNVIFLKYEDMKNDISKVIKIIANFFNKNITDAEIAHLSQHLNFETMKRNPAVNKEHIAETYKKNQVTNYTGKFFRSGQVGDYKTAMSPELINRFDKWIKTGMEATDYVV